MKGNRELTILYIHTIFADFNFNMNKDAGDFLQFSEILINLIKIEDEFRQLRIDMILGDPQLQSSYLDGEEKELVLGL